MTVTQRYHYDDGQVEVAIEEFEGHTTPGIAVTYDGITVTITRQVRLAIGLPGTEDMTVEETPITVWIDTDEDPSVEVLRVRLNDAELHN